MPGPACGAGNCLPFAGSLWLLIGLGVVWGVAGTLAAQLGVLWWRHRPRRAPTRARVASPPRSSSVAAIQQRLLRESGPPPPPPSLSVRRERVVDVVGPRAPDPVTDPLGGPFAEADDDSDG
ncbi:MAG: hypothetical protein ACRDQJ_18885 [Pseudonocardiaceae bacterium]